MARVFPLPLLAVLAWCASLAFLVEAGVGEEGKGGGGGGSRSSGKKRVGWGWTKKTEGGRRSWGEKLGKKSPIKKTDNQENNDLRRLRKISDATRRSGMKQFQFGESFTGMYARQFSKK